MKLKKEELILLLNCIYVFGREAVYSIETKRALIELDSKFRKELKKGE